MKVFVTKKDTIQVNLFAFEKDGHIEAVSAMSEIPENTPHEKLQFTFKKPSYSDSTVILRNASIRQDGVPMNITQFQDTILRTLLLSWNLKDEDGKDMPVNSTTIDILLPVVARSACTSLLEQVKL